MTAFSVPGRPVPKGRPRTRVVQPTFGKAFAQVYTPPTTRSYEALVRGLARQAHGPKQIDGPVLAAVVWHGKQGRTDLDNVVKAILDACEGVVYPNDVRVRGLFKWFEPAKTQVVHVRFCPLSEAGLWLKYIVEQVPA